MLLLLLVLLAQPAAALRNHTWAVVHVNAEFNEKGVNTLINVRHHVRHSVPIYIVTSVEERANYERIAEAFNLKFPPLTFAKSKSTAAYQRLLTGAEFWLAFREEYLLLMQEDARFCDRSGRRVEDFIGLYDYIGAPWRDVQGAAGCVGNGGFSLRNRAAMLVCCRQHNFNRRAPEDLTFSACLRRLNYRLPTCEQAQLFAAEQYITGRTVPLAVHDTALHYKNRAFMTKNFPEYDFLAGRCPEAVFIY